MTARLMLRRVVGADLGRTAFVRLCVHALLPALAAALIGCGRPPLPAAVEGTLRLNGRPLENCLVIFLPEPGQAAEGRRFVGLTDANGHYRLRCDDQQEGVGVGWHRIVLQDMSVSTGVVRQDHGTVAVEAAPPPPARRSRLPPKYTSPTQTPLRKEVKPERQTIDLDIS
ncbi:MAG: hypothetical protein GX594_15235 [Pirellulaceae bacterium]|nr:hypothetical protein [Pirellulaceae bacterium]